MLQGVWSAMTDAEWARIRRELAAEVAAKAPNAPVQANLAPARPETPRKDFHRTFGHENGISWSAINDPLRWGEPLPQPKHAVHAAPLARAIRAASASQHAAAWQRAQQICQTAQPS